MSIHSNHPAYVDFLDHEIMTLTFLVNNPVISKKFSSISKHAELMLHNYTNLKKRDKPNTNFTFATDFDLVIEKQMRKVVVEAGIESKFQIASYVLSICRKHQPRPTYALMRKFHFDYAIPDGRDPKPVYHLQYGGKQSPHLRTLKITVDHLGPWLSLPRINFVPMNLALLLDMVFSQFISNDTNEGLKTENGANTLRRMKSFF